MVAYLEPKCFLIQLVARAEVVHITIELSTLHLSQSCPLF